MIIPSALTDESPAPGEFLVGGMFEPTWRNSFVAADSIALSYHSMRCGVMVRTDP